MAHVRFLGESVLAEWQSVCQAMNLLPDADKQAIGWIYLTAVERDPRLYYGQQGFCGEAWLHPSAAEQGFAVRFRGREFAYTNGTRQCDSYYSREFLVQHEFAHAVDAATVNRAAPQGRFASYRADCREMLSSRPTIQFPNPTGFCNDLAEPWATYYADTNGGRR